jgi:glycine/D-amino acid oxidase-like deaminating enzyme
MGSGIDIAVVGGGILARAIAHRLAGPERSVAWVRPAGPTTGASAAAGAMLGVYSEVSQHDSAERRLIELEARRDARRRYGRWLDSIADDGGERVDIAPGLFVVGNASGEDDEGALDAIAGAAAGSGEPATELRARDVPGYAPHAGARGFRALFLDAEGSVDAGALLRALEAALEARRVRIEEGEVARVDASEAGVALDLVGGRRLTAGSVVLAVGVETTRLLQRSELGAAQVPPVFGGRGVSLVMRAARRPERTIRTPNRTFACGLHIVPQADGGLYLGATNRLSMLPDGEPRPSVGEVAQLVSGATRELDTRLADAEVVGVRIGHRPVTGDRLPCVGRTAVRSVLVATGTYRNGVLLAPLCADLIGREVEVPGSTADHPFRPDRAPAAPLNGELDAWLRRSSRSLVTTMLEPGGSLPDHRAEDLERFFYAVMRSALHPDADREGLFRKLDRAYRRAPIEEAVPLLFDVISRHST